MPNEGPTINSLKLYKMKKLKTSLFDKEKTLKKVNLEGIYGGANKSDVNYTDSKGSKSYDIAVLSLIDTVDSKQSLDKPSFKYKSNNSFSMFSL